MKISEMKALLCLALVAGVVMVQVVDFQARRAESASVLVRSDLRDFHDPIPSFMQPCKLCFGPFG